MPDDIAALRHEVTVLTDQIMQQRQILSLLAGQMNALMEGASRMTEANSRLYEGLGKIATGPAAMLDRQTAAVVLAAAPTGPHMN